jgi:hypothetical protein
MTKTILLLTAALGLTISAQAQNWNGQSYGNQDYWHSNQGDNYSGQRYGNQYYWSGTDRYGNYHSGSIQHYGNQWYSDGN